MEDLKRWDIDNDRCTDGNCRSCHAEMKESPDGSYVEYDDVTQRLAAQLDRTPPLHFTVSREEYDLAMNASREAYERLLNQAASLRVIADRATLCAIGEMDLTEFSVEDCELIERFMSQTDYMDRPGEEDADVRTVFVTEVLQRLIEADVAPLLDYVTMSRRELTRKQRIKEELGQLKVLGESWSQAEGPQIASVFERHPSIKLEFEMARAALLFASSDVDSRELLMELSPAVRLTKSLSEIHQQARAATPAAQVDWSQVGEGEEPGRPELY